MLLFYFIVYYNVAYHNILQLDNMQNCCVPCDEGVLKNNKSRAQ